jgi:hypothetical protein
MSSPLLHLGGWRGVSQWFAELHQELLQVPHDAAVPLHLVLPAAPNSVLDQLAFALPTGVQAGERPPWW